MYTLDIVADAARMAYNNYWKKVDPDNLLFKGMEKTWDELTDNGRKAWRRVAHTVLRAQPYDVDLGGGD